MKDDTLNKICTLIYRETNDEQIELIRNALLNRSRRIQQERLSSIVPLLRQGARVRIKGCKPQYLNGTTGTIIGRKGAKFRVELDPGADPRAMRRFGNAPICPPHILDPIRTTSNEEE